MPNYKTLTPDEVTTRLAETNEVFLLDIRDPRAFHTRHIPGAILMPADDFADRYDREVDPDDEVILVCERGQNSEAAADYLLAQGFTDVATMAGGMAAYTGAVEP